MLPLVASLSLAVLALVPDARAFTFPPGDGPAYNRGDFGEFPEVKYRTTDIVSPKVFKRKWDPSCAADSDYYFLLAPYGYADNQPGPLILDNHGNLVWHQESDEHAYGLMVQQYQGEPYLTWWSGDDSVRGHGVGRHHMLDQNYRLYRNLTPMNDLPADLHEFKITSDDTAIVTSFPQKAWDLSAAGLPADGYIWDGVFQEFDIESGEVLFQWRASDHFAVTDCFTDIHSPDSKGTQELPMDYYHINSIDKDEKGNYLVSARYCGISYLDGTTGEVLWNLGGFNNSFTDLSNGKATDMRFQHHARWADDYTTITMFDNQVTAHVPSSWPSRGLKVEIDQQGMTARMVKDFVHPNRFNGVSQGSMQSLDNGNFLLGFGHAAAFVEFYPDGKVACDAQFAPVLLGPNGKFKSGAGQSYRVHKQRWVGKPHWNPRILFDQRLNKMFVSWNGATEVRKWRLSGSTDGINFSYIHEAIKNDFESAIEVHTEKWAAYVLTAYAKSEVVIGKWSVTTSGTVEAIALEDSGEAPVPQRLTMPTYPTTGMVLVVGVALIAVGMLWSRRRRGSWAASDIFLRKGRYSGPNSFEAERESQREGLLGAHD